MNNLQALLEQLRNLDPNDPVVEFLEPGDLLVDVRAKLLRHAAVPGLDDNIHGDLHRYWAVPNRVNFPTHTHQSLAPVPRICRRSEMTMALRTP